MSLARYKHRTPTRNQWIVAHFWESQSYAKTAREYSLNPYRIRQIVEQAGHDLREPPAWVDFLSTTVERRVDSIESAFSHALFANTDFVRESDAIYLHLLADKITARRFFSLPDARGLFLDQYGVGPKILDELDRVLGTSGPTPSDGQLRGELARKALFWTGTALLRHPKHG